MDALRCDVPGEDFERMRCVQSCELGSVVLAVDDARQAQARSGSYWARGGGPRHGRAAAAMAGGARRVRGQPGEGGPALPGIAPQGPIDRPAPDGGRSRIDDRRPKIDDRRSTIDD